MGETVLVADMYWWCCKICDLYTGTASFPLRTFSTFAKTVLAQHECKSVMAVMTVLRLTISTQTQKERRVVENTRQKWMSQ